MSKEIRLRAAVVATALAAILSVACASYAVAGGGRTMRGKTSQGNAIRLKDSGGSLRLLHFTAKLKCRDGSVLTDIESGFQPTRLRGGRFSDRQIGSTDTVRFNGKASRGVVRGRIRVQDKLGHVPCDSHWLRFTARG
jgi:hypothetical protein